MREITADYLPLPFQKTVDYCVENHEVLHVNRQTGEYLVVIGAEDWRAIEETLFLTRIPGFV